MSYGSQISVTYISVRRQCPVLDIVLSSDIATRKFRVPVGIHDVASDEFDVDS
jgi:hypothetical protein